MIFQQTGLAAGLYIVATPIGNARDITLRALDVLASADVIAAEDTRTARRLLEIHGVPLGTRKLIAYHDHSSARDRDRLIERIKTGESVALISEAGTPLISDPGYGLVADLREQELAVTAIPGACAVVAALCVSGLPSDAFHFVGFLPAKSGARKSAVQNLATVEASLVFYESPKRVGALLAELEASLGGHRRAVLCRELTKKFEESIAGRLDELAARYAEETPRGECVVVVEYAPPEQGASDQDIEQALATAMETMRLKDAATMVAGSFGMPVRDVYQIGLRVKAERQ